MSIIKVNSIKNTATNDGGIAIDNSGHVQIDGQQLPNAGSLSNRNLVVNGAMQVAQRATQATGITTTTNPYRTVDRHAFHVQTLGTWTMDQGSGTPENGFSYSAKMTCTTADASPTSGSYALLLHFIEAQDVQHLLYGTSNAKSVTVSFWVKSNKTGTASFDLIKEDTTNEFYSLQYEIDSANTWEYKTLTIPGNTLNSINNDTGRGLQLTWWLNSGSNFSGGSHSTAWAATGFPDSNRNVSNLGVGGAVNDYFEITGVQLEAGSVATPFEHRSYGEELAKCQRYLFRINADASEQSCLGVGRARTGGNVLCCIPFPVAMREKTGKTVSEADCNIQYRTSNSNVSFDSITAESELSIDIRFSADSGAPFTAGDAVNLRVNDGSGHFQVDSEL
tara:strand:+ start:1395 stop:2570 length:1176 start_codon:yes stop_codon:yes gene_type:complete